MQTARSLEEGHRDLVIPENNDVVFDENNGKLVHVADRLRVDDPLEEHAYGISIKAVKLRRVVQMYQWYEVEDRTSTHNEGEHDFQAETTTYSYATGWFDQPINSDAFDSSMGHHNPEADEWTLNSTTVTNPRAKIGGFLLGDELKARFDDFTVFTSDERPASRDIKMHAGLYFHAQNVWKPEVGDVRVQFSYAGHDGDMVR